MIRPTDSLSEAAHSSLAWMARLLLTLAQEQSIEVILQRAVDACLTLPGAAGASVLLLGPGDSCSACPFRSVCPDQKCCLHRKTLAFNLDHPDSEADRTTQENRYLRVPLGIHLVSQPISSTQAVIVQKRETEAWRADLQVTSPDFLKFVDREKIVGVIHQPILDRGEVLGVLSLWLRIEPTDADVPLSRIIADHLAAAIAKAQALAEIEKYRQRLELHNEYLREEINTQGAFGSIIGQSPAIRNILEQIELVASTGTSVLILGESGTGKELVAREIHNRSRHSRHPLVKVNCAAIPAELYESEFFGHVKGAFTGAVRDRAGRFEVANGGTLFLDEVGEIPLSLQSKLLRVLQEGTYERVGDDQTRQANVRILAATNRDLSDEVAARRFRQDLYYRLNVFPITLTPLRERKEDIPFLAAHLLDRVCQRTHLPRPELTRVFIRDLQQYDWPGNIRELENALERCVILARRHGLLRFDLAGAPAQTEPTKPLPLSEPEETQQKAVLTDAQLRQLERENIVNALQRTEGRIRGSGGAAELLGLKATTLAARIKALGISRPGDRPPR